MTRSAVDDVLPGDADPAVRLPLPCELEGTEVAVTSVVTVVNVPPASVDIAVELTRPDWKLEVPDTVAVVVKLELAGAAELTLEPEDEDVVTSVESVPPLTMSD